MQYKKGRQISQYNKEYQAMMQTPLALPSGDRVHQQLRAGKVLLAGPPEHNEKEQSGFECVVELTRNESETVVYSIRTQGFHIKLFLLNVKGRNPLLNHQEVGRGNYGKVFFFNFLQQEVVAKVLPYNP
jgi:hypothetical protein